MTDKEYCLYFRKNGYCNPQNYEDAKTVYYMPINMNDKNIFEHPTIKPKKIIETLIKNSSTEGQVVADFFMGSGTTCVAAKDIGRRYIGIEIEKKWFDIAKDRLDQTDANGQMSLFLR